MKVKYFLSIAIVYIALVLAYVFYAVGGDYTLNNGFLIDFSVDLPVALWICIPLVGLLVIALICMVINALVLAYRNFSLRRDMERISSQIREASLGEDPRDRVFKTPELGQVSRMLRRFHLSPNLQSEKSDHPKLDSVFSDLKNIKDGLEVSKLDLSPKSPLYIQNLKNSMKDDAHRSLQILRSGVPVIEASEPGRNEDQSVQSLYELAWENILDSKSSRPLKRALQLDDMRLSPSILEKICLFQIQGRLGLSASEIARLCKLTSLSEREYLSIVIELCKFVNSSNIAFWLDVFESLSKEVEKSVFAYFYLLLEVGKTSEAMELKKQYPKDDYLPVSAFMALKDKGYPLLVFFEPLLFRANKHKKAPATSSNTVAHRDYALPD